MYQGIFSTYRQGENRVTASILAVLRSLALPKIDRLLGELLNEDDFRLVRFENQIVGNGDSVPDGEIAANRRIFIETKTKRNTLDREQLQSHLKQLGNDVGNRLLVLTPDSNTPEVVKEIGDDRLAWASFVDFDSAIDDLLLRNWDEVVSEREEFLLRELQKMFEADGLLGPAKEVVVVAARLAWPEYGRIHAYICQPDRSFQRVKYLAFYSDRKIQECVPAISEVCEQTIFKRGLHHGRLGEVVKQALDLGLRREGASHKVFLLSSPDDPQTIKLGHPIENDLSRAFVQGQRYVSLESLKKARKTSQID